MAQNQPLLVAPPMASTTDDELLQAEAMLWCHALGYMKTMALQCAITLGIPNAIHRHGGEASLPDLHAAVPVATTKRPCLSRLMRFLAASGIFAETTTTPADAAAAAGGPRYRLTAASRFLVDGGDTCLTQMMLLMASPLGVAASQSLAGWLVEEGGATAAAETPFAAAHGKALYEFLSRDAEFGARFGAAMGADSRVVSGMLVGDGGHGGEVFAGVASLVDAGGGDGTMARAIAGAFPHVRCTVLELPFVVDDAAAAVPAGDGTVEFVAGDMMEFIPPADAVLFKGVLHNWSDEDCVRTLKRAREAISTREPKGKVIIIDIVIGSPSKQTLEAQLCLDLCMMVQTTGKEREEETWHRIFRDAGFTRYKIRPGLGPRSLIEVYP
ncbi:unnamed protein product [Urochloa decumbens]|uniref:Uncharacterized protein n=1 Tax=Urochloa decumbens TaxID=240449 RepID=A0ABC9FPU6_9POAL